MKESIQESNKNQSESNYYTATQKSFVTTDFLPDKESNLKKSYDSPKKTAPSPSNTRPRRRDLEVVRKHENQIETQNSEEKQPKDKFAISFGAKDKQANFMYEYFISNNLVIQQRILMIFKK